MRGNTTTTLEEEKNTARLPKLEISKIQGRFTRLEQVLGTIRVKGA